MSSYKNYSDAKAEALRKFGHIERMTPEMLTAVTKQLDVFIETRVELNTENINSRLGASVMSFTQNLTSVGDFLGGFRYAVRNDDIEIFQQLLPSAAGLAAVPFFGGGATAIVGLIVSIVTIAHSLRKHGVTLTEEQYHVLLALKAIGPASVKDLAAACGGISVSPDKTWDPQKVEKILEQLHAIPNKSRVVTALADKSFDGLWSSAA